MDLQVQKHGFCKVDILIRGTCSYDWSCRNQQLVTHLLLVIFKR